MNKTIIALCLGLAALTSCEDQFTPADDNHLTFDEVYRSPSFAEGILMNAYSELPNYNYASDIATDDAVTNNKDDSYLKMATGQWSAINNPTSRWDDCYSAILYLNKMIEVADDINWAPITGEPTNSMYKLRHVGEAYGLRAYFMFYLLQAHAGMSEDGTLLGVPIITESVDGDIKFDSPRDSFEDCVQQILSDLTKAESLLPLDYKNVSDVSEIPTAYRELGVSPDQYNVVCGNKTQQRISGRILKGIRSKITLLAASPAYGTMTWAEAADAAAASLDLIGGISGLDSSGALYYLGNQVDGLNVNSGNDQAEMLWRGNVYQDNWMEQAQFPPTLYGEGRVNPSQNLVDAFPMANGYPITDTTNSEYDANNPYANRDPRLAAYVVYNGATLAGHVIDIEQNSGNDAVNAISTSTRTGYYLRKLLREDTNLDPTLNTKQKRYSVYIRYTEIFLNYAEAANEAWGPDGKGTHTYSAKDVIAAIRQRAGLPEQDTYLESIQTKEDMRTLIHNERRLELCFEGFRFWDIRRWKANLTEPARGITIASGVLTNTTVEPRVYKDYMYYGPIPYQESLKFDLIQNKGW